MTPKEELIIHLIESLNEDPDDWEIDEYTAKRGSTQLWIACGWTGIYIQAPVDVKMSCLWRWRLWKAIEGLKAYKLIKVVDDL